MSKAYEKKKTPSSGTGLFITKDLKAGELVLRDKTPFVAVLDSSVLTKACSWCCLLTEEASLDDEFSVSACTGCKIVRYCGKVCQTLSWKHSHKYECKVFKALYPQVLPNTARMMVQLLLRHKNNAISKEDWDSFLRLEHHIYDLENGARNGKDYCTQTLQNVQLLARAGEAYSGSSENPGYVELLAGRLITNTLTLASPIFTPLGLFLSLPGSLLNHSCRPNCAIVYNGRTMDLRVLEPTKSGTELTISYTHTTLSIDMRRSDLQNRYHFTCNCGECSHGLTLDQPDLSLAVQLLSSSPIRPSFETEIASLLTKAKDLPAAEGLVLVAEAYQRCREHTDYPQWLSPLYQLRFDLIMGLQANKLWVAAFIQSMILHFKAQPIVHSQLSHPARVARGWIHAKMAGHIGGLANELDFASSVGAPDEGELAKSLGLEFGLDWGMVVYTLVKEVSDQVLKSHGLESRFSLEVGREMGKIKQEARDTRGEPIEEDLERTKAQLGAVANKGWDWWIQQMRDPQGSRMRLVQSSEPCTQNALSVLLE